MARAGILLYLMFAVAAGPSLCCCSGDRLLDRLVSAKHLKTAARRCCNHNANGRSQHVPADKQHPETPPHDPCQCPGGESPPLNISLAKSGFGTDSTRQLTLSPEFGPSIFCTGDPLSWHRPAENAGFAFASLVQNPRDILSVLQTLRC